MKKPLKYGIPSYIDGVRNPAYWQAYNNRIAGLRCAGRRNLTPEQREEARKRQARLGKRCAACGVNTPNGRQPTNGFLLRTAVKKGKHHTVFICHECQPEGRLTEPLWPRRKSAEIIRTRPLRQAYRIPDEQLPGIPLELIYELFESLRESQARIMKLLYIAGLSVTEVGKMEKVTYQAVWNREQSALRRIRLHRRPQLEALKDILHG